MQKKIPWVIKWMRSLCYMSKWEGFSLITLVKQKLRRDVIATYKYRLERMMCGSACREGRQKRKSYRWYTALAQHQMKTMYLETRTKCLNLRAMALGNSLSGMITETRKSNFFWNAIIYWGFMEHCTGLSAADRPFQSTAPQLLWQRKEWFL